MAIVLTPQQPYLLKQIARLSLGMMSISQLYSFADQFRGIDDLIIKIIVLLSIYHNIVEIENRGQIFC
jgi:hypothetical protein